VVMAYAGISLQRISLGALIIALGLLVDDAMIAVEMMVARLEVGDSLNKAATYVYTSTAFPMLTGTVVTVIGFIPIAFNSSNAGEFAFTLFVVIAVSLLVSWIVAVLFTPLLGVSILPATLKGHHEQKGRVARIFSRMLAVCMHHRWISIGVTVVAFLLAVFGMGFVQQQFFPSSDRGELVIDFNLPQNASIAETDAQIARFEREQLQGNDGVDHWSSYIGTGAPRFILSFDLQTPIAVVPLMLFLMATILMVQLQSFHRLFLVFAVAPLAVIGVVLALLPSGAPLGFVAILGVMALIGILIRNSVILVVQIKELEEARRPAWQAVVEATEHRMRPIMLTAAAASLGLIPIAREIFWGPMAYAMMGGIIVGTVLTLLFLPALYVAWFRIKEPNAEADADSKACLGQPAIVESRELRGAQVRCPAPDALSHRAPEMS